MLWDLNRRSFVRALPADGAVDVRNPESTLVCISDLLFVSSVPGLTMPPEISSSVAAIDLPCTR